MDDSGPWLAAIVENSDDAILSKTLQGVITSWNPGAERLFGYAAHEVVGRSITLLIPADRADEEPRLLERIARGERVHHFETVRLRKDGTAVQVSVSISPVRDGQGRIVGASKIARDIGDRKLAEAQLRAQLARLHMLDQITRGIGEHQDLRSIYQVALRSVEERMPLDFACICAVGSNASGLIVSHIGVHSAALAQDIALAEQGLLTVDGDDLLSRCIEGRLLYRPDARAIDSPFAHRMASGSIRSVVLSPLSRESQVAGVLVAGRRDAHAFSSNDCEFLRQLSLHVCLAAGHAQLHASLQQAYDELRQSQQAALRHERLRALGHLASGIAHDINNIVFPASVFVRGLLEQQPNVSPRGWEDLHAVAQALDDVAAIIHRLRDFYRPRESQVPMVALSLNPLVHQALALARAKCVALTRSGIAVELQADLLEPLPEVLGSESEIREALLNLLFNAIDAMPDGGTVLVRTTAHAEPAGPKNRPGAALSVQDHGVGMDDEARRRCLDPFFTTKGELGTGMGLAMVYGTVQRHGAEIGIDSAPGIGTTVTLRFPPLPEPAGQSASAVGVEPGAGPALRILVIDDDPLVLETLKHLLAASGHDTVLAHGGQAGIGAFESGARNGRPFDVVMTDLGMPEVDGHAVARAVKSASPTTPVVLLTGWGEGLPIPGQAHSPMDVALGKPPRLSELREVLTRLGRRA